MGDVHADADPLWSSGGGWPDGPDVVVADHRLDPDHGAGIWATIMLPAPMYMPTW